MFQKFLYRNKQVIRIQTDIQTEKIHRMTFLNVSVNYKHRKEKIKFFFS